VDGRPDPFQIINECQTVDEGVVRDCCLHCLKELLFLFCQPLCDGFALAAELMVPLEPQDVSRLVVKVFDITTTRADKNLNDCNLESVIKPVVFCYQEGERALKSELESRLCKAIVDRDQRSFGLCLGAVRSLCSAIKAPQPAPGKTHYGEWFARAFGQVVAHEQQALPAPAPEAYVGGLHGAGSFKAPRHCWRERTAGEPQELRVRILF
jgi:hypothetical protein